MKPITIPVFDFDKTLAYNSNDIKVSDLFVRHGFEQLCAVELYEDVQEHGFSIDKMIEQARCVRSFDEEALRHEFDDWLCSGLRLYDDARALIEWLERRQMKWAIVTFGDEAYQKRKIELLGLKPDSIRFTSRVGLKGQELVSLCREFEAPIVFVDDRRAELDPMVEIQSEIDIGLFLIDRSGECVSEVPYIHASDHCVVCYLFLLNENPLFCVAKQGIVF